MVGTTFPEYMYKGFEKGENSHVTLISFQEFFAQKNVKQFKQTVPLQLCDHDNCTEMNYLISHSGSVEILPSEQARLMGVCW